MLNNQKQIWNLMIAALRKSKQFKECFFYLFLWTVQAVIIQKSIEISFYNDSSFNGTKF